jgi:hypothetical protein
MEKPFYSVQQCMMPTSPRSFAIRVNGTRLGDYVGLDLPLRIVRKVVMVGTWNGNHVTEMVVRASDRVNILIEDVPASTQFSERLFSKHISIFLLQIVHNSLVNVGGDYTIIEEDNEDPIVSQLF